MTVVCHEQKRETRGPEALTYGALSAVSLSGSYAHVLYRIC